ncbi:MAG TPA: hypothetical protein VMF30_05625 [Pirellulales bacterium]|nr:hypothetical protein [Pirellulales bacterium]
MELDALARMGEGACRLDEQERRLVTATIENHCARRGWVTHAINCRSNHVHVVLTAAARPAEVRRQLKAWTSRALGAHERERAVGRDVAPKPFRRRWWSERGSTRYLNDEAGLEAAILYVRDGQKTRRR